MNAPPKYVSYFPFIDVALSVQLSDNDVIHRLENTFRSEGPQGDKYYALKGLYGRIHGHTITIEQPGYKWHRIYYEGQIIPEGQNTLLMFRIRWSKPVLWFWATFLVIGILGGWNRTIFNSYYLNIALVTIVLGLWYFLVPWLKSFSFLKAISNVLK